MPVTPDQMHTQIDAAAYGLEKMSVKEREQKPHEQFVENYNMLRSLAMESTPSADQRRWPPAVTIHRPAMGIPSANASYAEILSYLKQMLAILSESVEPPVGGFLG